MKFPSNYRLTQATKADEAEIKSIFHQQKFPGNMSVMSLRDPYPLDSFLREGDELVMLVVRDMTAACDVTAGRMIGFGGCVIRNGYIDGEIKRIGYLTSMKMIPQYQKRFRGIQFVYAELRRLTENKVDVYFTTIIDDNKYVQKMLEKPRKNMPEYLCNGMYYTLFCAAGGHGRREGLGSRADLSRGIGRITDDNKKKRYRKKVFKSMTLPIGYRVSVCDSIQAQEFYRTKLKKKSDFSVADALQNDLTNAQFYGLYKYDELFAVGYVLDQRDYKQYVVDHYSGILRLVSSLPTELIGYPPFPKKGIPAAMASAGIWCDEDIRSDRILMTGLWNEMRSSCAQYNIDILTIGLYERDPLMSVFAELKTVDYKSRVYQVVWDDMKVLQKDGNVQPDVAFL